MYGIDVHGTIWAIEQSESGLPPRVPRVTEVPLKATEPPVREHPFKPSIED